MTTASEEWGVSNRPATVTSAISASPFVSLCLHFSHRNLHIRQWFLLLFLCTQRASETINEGFSSLKGYFFQSGLWHSFLHVSKDACKQIFLCVNPRNTGFIFLVQIRTFHAPKENKDWSSHPIWLFVSNAFEPQQVIQKNSYHSLKEKKNLG